MKSLGAQIQNLVESQLKSWALARDNYSALSNVLVRNIDFGNHQIRLQYNPKRIISSSAKVDTESLRVRPCFLCTHNRPVQQDGIPYLSNYLILLNPYPVFNPHFTIPSIAHHPQRIKENFGSMLSLAHDLPGYVIIYNGPGCGASAPDHFHFQAVREGSMPIEAEFHGLITEKLQISPGTVLCTVEPYNRKIIALISYDKFEAESVFNKIYFFLEHGLQSIDEPMMNILAWKSEGKWIILIFPRKLHRPWQYFETGDNQILLSPASIDMGGVLIIPRKEDYEKISKSDIEDIFNQVCVDDGFILQLFDRIIKGV